MSETRTYAVASIDVELETGQVAIRGEGLSDEEVNGAVAAAGHSVRIRL